MIRLALPKGRNLETALDAFHRAGVKLAGVEKGDRRLQVSLPDEGFEILFLKDWDVPTYIAQGIAEIGVVGSDVLEEVGGDLLVPARFTDGHSRLSLIGKTAELPEPGSQVRLASKYPETARRVVDGKPWGAEIFKLSGSVELGPLLDLSELALDIVQTGRTLRENHLVEIETVRDVAPLLVVNRAAYQLHRQELNQLLRRFEDAGAVE